MGHTAQVARAVGFGYPSGTFGRSSTVELEQGVGFDCARDETNATTTHRNV